MNFDLTLTSKSEGANKRLLIFFSVSIFINLIQAYFTGLHPDEAYYWVYSKFLDWGYFDHPPMVAIYIKTGSFLFKNTLGLRLITVFSNAAAIYLLWLIVKKYAVNSRLFILIISSILLFHVYSFITTPDVPLFFFSVLFLYIYQLYAKEDHLKWAILLGIICAGLLMSKYHGVLLIFFVLLSNLKLFTRKSFYLTIFIALILFSPHIYWQYLNGYPSLYYHLIDRSATPYRLVYTWQYFLDQLLMVGPLTGWLLFYYGFKLKTHDDAFLRACKFIVYGVLLFFFLSTFKGQVQAQWPLIEYIPLFILSTIFASQNTAHFYKFRWLFVINIALIFIARLAIMGFIPFLNQIKFIADFSNYDVWAQEIKAQSKGNPVLFEDGFQEASFYNFYTQSLNAVAYNSFNYRKTQYDLWPLEDSIQHHKVLLVTKSVDEKSNVPSINTVKGKYNLQWLDSLRIYPKINFEPIDFPTDWRPNEEKNIVFSISNPYLKTVDFSMKDEKWPVKFLYGFLKDGEVYQTHAAFADLNHIQIAAKSNQKIIIKIKAPQLTGDYKLFLSVKTEPFAGTRNSKLITIKVKP